MSGSLEKPIRYLSIPREDVDFCMQWLSNIFSTEFKVYEWNQTWTSDQAKVTWSEQQTETVELILENVGVNTTFATHLVDDKMALHLLPLETTNRRPRIAACLIPRRNARTLSHMIELLLEQLDLNRLACQSGEPALGRTSFRYEELSWYRSLVEQMSFREDLSDLTTNAMNCLQQLMHLIRAQSLVMVLRKDCDDLAQDEQQVFQIGNVAIPHWDISRLIQLAGTNACCESYMDLHIRGLTQAENDQAQSVAIVPLINTKRCLGWLIAISHPHQYSPGSKEFYEIDAETRFDTRTSLLLESAASVFAAEAHNQHLRVQQNELLLGTVRSLVNALETKDRYTFGHSDRVAQMARLLSLEYGLSEQDSQRIFLSGLLHDIGKIGVSDEVLSKPGRLTAAEFDEIKMHPQYGYEILKHLHQIKHVLPGVLHHHESWDGTGYPHQLSDYDIPLSARILAVADAYDAMTSDRPYRDGMPIAQAEAILKEGAGQQWDPDLVNAFFRIIPEIREIAKQDHFGLKQQQQMQGMNETCEDSQKRIDTILSAIVCSTRPSTEQHDSEEDDAPSLVANVN